MRPFFIAFAILVLLASVSRAGDKPHKAHNNSAEITASDWVFLDNGVSRLGVKKTAGAGIGWLSRIGSSENLLDHWDEGRFMQQSYYGKKDGSLWGKKPWTWNPVQGGDCQGHAAEVLELSGDKTTPHARIRPRNWASGELLADCEMEKTIRLKGAVAVVKFGFRYHGTGVHPLRSQEVPATFINPAYGTMVVYQGDQPWSDGALTRSQPGWPNEPRKIPEGWVAWVNDQNTGVGVFSPVAILPVNKPGAAWDGSLNNPWLGEKGMLAEGGMRVPFIMNWPGQLPAGKVYEPSVSTLDIASTAVAFAGLPPDDRLDGVNLMPFLTGKNTTAPHEALYWRLWDQAAVRAGKWKYLQAGTAAKYLFDVTSDEHEKKSHPAASGNCARPGHQTI